MKVSADATAKVVEERLDVIPGRLTLYGNNVAVRKLPLDKALDETVAEGLKIVRDELNHFLKGRGKQAYLSALKAAATRARWSEVKGAMAARRGSSVNDGTAISLAAVPVAWRAKPPER